MPGLNCCREGVLLPKNPSDPIATNWEGASIFTRVLISSTQACTWDEIGYTSRYMAAMHGIPLFQLPSLSAKQVSRSRMAAALSSGAV